MAALLYFAVKFIVYSAWCFVGLGKFRHDQKSRLARAVAYGAFRFFLGFFFGVLIWLISSALMSKLGYGVSQNVATYLLVYVPVRWIEWAIMAVMIKNPGWLALSLMARFASFWDFSSAFSFGL